MKLSEVEWEGFSDSSMWLYAYFEGPGLPKAYYVAKLREGGVFRLDPGKPPPRGSDYNALEFAYWLQDKKQVPSPYKEKMSR